MNKEYKNACKFTLMYQIFLGLFASMNLDGGQLFRFWFIAMSAYLVSVAMILYRDSKTINKEDLFYLKFGSLIILGITPIIVGTVWGIKGVY